MYDIIYYLYPIVYNIVCIGILRCGDFLNVICQDRIDTRSFCTNRKCFEFLKSYFVPSFGDFFGFARGEKNFNK